MPIVDCGFPPNMRPPPGFPAMPVNLGAMFLQGRGPTVLIEVGFEPNMFHTDPATVQAAIATAHSAPIQSGQNVRAVLALIDTGASECCIDEKLANDLGLPLIDKAKGSGIGGQDEFSMYLGHIRIPALGSLMYGQFMGIRLLEGGQHHHALIGRTLLAGMVMVYDGRTGQVSISM